MNSYKLIYIHTIYLHLYKLFDFVNHALYVSFHVDSGWMVRWMNGWIEGHGRNVTRFFST